MIIQCHGCNPREMIQSTLAVISALFIMIIISFFHPFLLIFIHGIFYKSIWAFFFGCGAVNELGLLQSGNVGV